MAFVTVGNLKRFLEKLKTYISGNYVTKGGDVLEGVYEFKVDGEDEIPSVTVKDGRASIAFSNPNVAIIGSGNSDSGLHQIYEDGSNWKILDARNYNDYSPKKDGTGATGTWPINITGNATNDSNGDKIVDTYAKKTDIPTDSITVDDRLNISSENPVQNKVIYEALKDKLGNGGWVYSKEETYGNAGYYANNVLQRAGVEQYPFLEVQFRDKNGPKVSISSNDVTVHGNKDSQNAKYKKVMLDVYGLTYSYGKYETKLILDETLNGGIRLMTNSDSLTIPCSYFDGYEKKLKFNSDNVATEDYVKSAIAAIASYDDTAF